MNKVLFSCTLIFIFMLGCGSYIDKIHREIDHAEAIDAGPVQKPRDAYAYNMYRRVPRGNFNDRRPIQKPKTYSLQKAGQKMSPKVKREYKRYASLGKKRYSANDFIDQDNSSSLWTNQHGMTTDLFIANERKKVGDLIVVGVMDNLKREISNELKRAFPLVKKDIDDDNKEDDESDENQSRKTASTDQSDENKPMQKGKIYDKISSQVAEEISNDYILLKGQKELIFRGQKRLIEIQALVARKDISPENDVPSDKILESRVYILR